MRMLILSDDKGNLLPNEIKNVAIEKVYKKKIANFLLRSIRKMHLSSLIPFKKIWFGSWYAKLKDYDSLILFANGNSNHIIDCISRKNKNIQINLWYWGPTELIISPLKFANKPNVHIWSFDYRDCDKFNLKFNSQFYCFENLERFNRVGFNENFDVFFIGTEKNRLNELISLGDEFDRLGIVHYFHIVKSGSHYHNDVAYSYKSPISYQESLSLISKSKAILDINDLDQTGLSLHPMEALFFKKKLITNNSYIKKEKLYNKNNVFILNEDDINKLKEFIDKPFDDENYVELTNYYSMQSWANRFEM